MECFDNLLDIFLANDLAETIESANNIKYSNNEESINKNVNNEESMNKMKVLHSIKHKIMSLQRNLNTP